MDSLTAETAPDTYAIIGAALEVHKAFGPGFLEAVYQEALAKEFRFQGIEFVREAPIQLYYRGEPLMAPYRADFLVQGEFIVELKAISCLGRIEEAQVVHYLKATRLETGLLLNFGAPSLQVRRLTSRRTPSQGLEGSPFSPQSPFGS